MPDEVVIVWENDNPATEALLEEWAVKSAAEINTIIWPKLTGLFGKPPQGKLVAILLSPLVRRSYETTDDCKIARIRLGTQDVNTLAHELTHALVDLRFPEKCNSSETLWLHEATATWAEHFVYPRNNREHASAPSFLRRPEVELEKYESTPDDRPGPEHQYGAYLWFLYITRGSDSGAHYVRETWDAIFNHDSLGAIEEAIGSLGGFRGEWPQFALYNWNRKADFEVTATGSSEKGKPYRYYSKWDKLVEKAREMTPAPVKVRLNGKTSATYSLEHTIPHLAARYFHYDFKADNAIRSLSFTHPYWSGSEPTARVQAIVKIRDQEWKPAEDWTDSEKIFFCRDKPAEDVEELVIVISNSEFKNRSHVLSDVGNFVNPAELKVFALGCEPWIGSVEFSYTNSLQVLGAREDVTETATGTNIVFDLVDPENGTYRATSGLVTWNHAGSFSGGGLECSGEATGTFLVAAGESQMTVTTFSPPVGDDSTLFYSGIGEVNMLQTNIDFIFYGCTPAGIYPPQQQQLFRRWLTTNAPIPLGSFDKIITDADGSLVMKGSSKQGPMKWQWEFKQARKAQ